MNYGFDFSFVEEFWHSLFVGAWLTTKMAVVSLLLGFLLGVALAIARTEGGAVPRKLAAAFVDLTRNTPLIVQTFWLFFGLARSEEHTSEIQSLMRISYAVFCLKKKKKHDQLSKYRNIT